MSTPLRKTLTKYVGPLDPGGTVLSVLLLWDGGVGGSRRLRGGSGPTIHRCTDAPRLLVCHSLLRGPRLLTTNDLVMSCTDIDGTLLKKSGKTCPVTACREGSFVHRHAVVAQCRGYVGLLTGGSGGPWRPVSRRRPPPRSVSHDETRP